MQTQTQEKNDMMNGVNVEKMHEIIDATKETPSLGQLRFRVQNKWIDGALNRSTIKEFYAAGEKDTTRMKAHVQFNDEPTALLGRDRSASPSEYLLHGLAGCMTTSLVYHAAAQGIEIEEIESEFEGELDLNGFLGLDKNVPIGYEKIRATFRYKGNATEEQMADFYNHSVVYNTVINPTPVTVTVQKMQ